MILEQKKTHEEYSCNILELIRLILRDFKM